MNVAFRITIFVVCNLIGFFGVGICYAIGLKTGAFSGEVDPQRFQETFMLGTMVTWLVCAFFSIGYFFTQSRWRKVFVIAPAVLPLCYGLYVILL